MTPADREHILHLFAAAILPTVLPMFGSYVAASEEAFARAERMLSERERVKRVAAYWGDGQ